MIFASLGRDTFVFNTGDGHDMIYGFEPGEDMLDLRGIPGGGDSNDAQQDGNDVLLDLGNGDSITLVDLDLGDFLAFDDIDIFV